MSALPMAQLIYDDVTKKNLLKFEKEVIKSITIEKFQFKISNLFNVK